MNHSFKLNSNTKKEKVDYSLIYMIIFIIIAVISLIIYFVMKNNDNKKENNTEIVSIKKDNNKDYVYTLKREINETEEDTYIEIPTINLEGSKYDILNKEIIENYNDVIKNQEYDYSYKFNVSKNILSLLITLSYTPKEGAYPVITYKSYNIDLVTDTILDNEELLQKYNLTEEQLNAFVGGKFQYYYEQIVSEGYYTKDACSYECFINNRGITSNYLDGISLYVDNGKLILCKYYYKDSEYNEAKFFDNISYEIIVKKKV